MLRNAAWLFVFAFVVLLVFLPSYSKMQDLRQKNAQYGAEIKNLKEENIRLSDERTRLERDPVYLEKVGREKMGLVKEGEVVYKIVPANKAE